jgi:hypothetical protein
LGYVRDSASGAPVGGAQVVVGEMTIVTDASGGIPQTAVPIAASISEVDVSVTAAGYAPWRYRGVMLQAGQPVELHVTLRRAGVAAPVDLSPSVPKGGPVPAAFTGVTPEYVDVGRTYTTACIYPPPVVTVERMRFVDYVRNVLPNEWVASWPDASLDAGAVAAKQFAWYFVFKQKWRSQGYPFDLVDSTCDQVYRDGSAHPNTDAAIARTWSTYLTRSGNLFPTFFRDTDAACQSRQPKDCMGQWGSYDLARAGYSAQQILLYYYKLADFNLTALDLHLEPRAYIPLILR